MTVAIFMNDYVCEYYDPSCNKQRMKEDIEILKQLALIKFP